MTLLEELKEQIFKLSYELDSYSVARDYVSLRLLAFVAIVLMIIAICLEHGLIAM